MTKDDIIRISRKAGFADGVVEIVGLYGFMKFATLAAAAEREECAKVCEAVQQKNEDNGAWMWEAKNCAAAIRARGNT